MLSRVRVILDGRVVVDTCAARYVWEHQHYPRYYVPVDDIASGLLTDEKGSDDTQFGPAARFGIGETPGVCRCSPTVRSPALRESTRRCL
jgi:hypothetical protein